MPSWTRLAIIGAVLLCTAVLARLIDRQIARRELDPVQATRYRVLRRSIATGIAVVGVLSALLVIPQVRAVAGGLLASSAVLGIIVGFASRSTLANFVAGLLIAFTQPVRLGDLVCVGDDEGVVEEIGLTYTFIRTRDEARVVIPNEKLASDTIRNSTIRSRELLAHVTLQIPLDRDLQNAVDLVREAAESEQTDVLVTDVGEKATLTVRAWAPDAAAVERLESDIRLRALARLRAAGMLP